MASLTFDHKGDPAAGALCAEVATANCFLFTNSKSLYRECCAPELLPAKGLYYSYLFM